MDKNTRFVFMDLRDLTTGVVEEKYVEITFYLARTPISLPGNTILGGKLTPEEARVLAQNLLKNAALAESRRG